MFENDKGKGIFMRKRNAQHFSAKQFYPNTWNVQNLHMPITIEACFSKHVHSRLVGYGINFICYFI